MTPQRIQRKRTKGYKLPENTVSVTRPGKWGNFLKLVGDQIYIDAGYRRKHLDKWVFLCNGGIEDLLRIYKSIVTGVMQSGEYGFEIGMLPDLLHWCKYFETLPIQDLRGKNLACFCKEGEPCHADVLLGIANQ